MKILFLTNVPSPYRVDFFNELGKLCDLTVVFEKKTSDERDTSWSDYVFKSFKGIFLRGKSINADTAVCPEVIKYVKDATFNYIICSNFTSPTGMLAIQYMKRHNIPYWLESDGGFAKDGRGVKEKLKYYFISGAMGYFSTGRTHDNYYIRYGAAERKIYRYPFTSLYEEDLLEEPLSLEIKNHLREKLEIKEKYVILAVGQFIHRKGFDILLESMRYISHEVGVYFVGGEPNEDYLKWKKALNLNNVHFIGFKSKKDLSEYYQAADVFVLPTREDIWGLVINEAMSYGLPVVSTKQCAAALELIRDGENGYVIPSESAVELADKIKKILNDGQLQNRFSKTSLEIIQNYTIEKMAQKHIDILMSNN